MVTNLCVLVRPRWGYTWHSKSRPSQNPNQNQQKHDDIENMKTWKTFIFCVVNRRSIRPDPSSSGLPEDGATNQPANQTINQSINQSIVNNMAARRLYISNVAKGNPPRLHSLSSYCRLSATPLWGTTGNSFYFLDNNTTSQGNITFPWGNNTNNKTNRTPSP